MDLKLTSLVKIDIDLTVLEFFKSAVRETYEVITSNQFKEKTDLEFLYKIRDAYLSIVDLLELLYSDEGVLESLVLKQSNRLKDDLTQAYTFIKAIFNEVSPLNEFKALKEKLTLAHKDHYICVLNILQTHPLFHIDEEANIKINPEAIFVLNRSHPIHQMIQLDSKLALLNKNRTRNFVIFDNLNHQAVFDITSSEVKLVPKIPFSDFEHDSNRTFVERVLSGLLFDFESKKTFYIKLLSKNKKRYEREINILNGKHTPSKAEVLVLISILGRLQQENEMGPITVFKDEKLMPTMVSNHTTNLNYIEKTIHTFNEFKDSLLANTEMLKLPFGKLEVIKQIKAQEPVFYPEFLLALSQNQLEVKKTSISTNLIKGSIESPNYLLSFFRKLILLPEYETIIPYFDQNDTLGSLASYMKRHRGTIELKDFYVVAKARGILMDTPKQNLMGSVHQVYELSKNNTYSKQVSFYLIEQKENLLNELFRLFFMLDRHVEAEKLNFKMESSQSETTSFNEADLSIASDMHLHDFNHLDKSNFSKNFNIIAGDFNDNLFHRGNVELTGKMDIKGVGVLGNHDVFLRTNPTRDLNREIISNYKYSIQNIKRFFPNIQVLNDEILYKDGFAIVGFTLVYDENDGIRTFFGNEEWGKKFNQDDYLSRAKTLLNQIPREMPVIFISHAPFKEYAVCTNKTLGVPSEYLFKDYPNVKVYIHGHGHSRPTKKKIQSVLCITNPILSPQSIFELSFSNDELKKVLQMDPKHIKTISN